MCANAIAQKLFGRGNTFIDRSGRWIEIRCLTKTKQRHVDQQSEKEVFHGYEILEQQVNAGICKRITTENR
jgi:hypothetical protein